MSDQINIEDSATSETHVNRGVRQCDVTEPRNGLLVKDFLDVF